MYNNYYTGKRVFSGRQLIFFENFLIQRKIIKKRISGAI